MKQDMLKDGANTFLINTNVFYDHWMTSQKNTIYMPRVNAYKEKISGSNEINAPILQSFQEENDGTLNIKTLYGRHRIAAAKSSGISEIYVRMSDELFLEINKLIPELISKNNVQTKNIFEDEEDDIDEDYINLMRF